MKERSRKQEEFVKSFAVKPGGRLTAKLDIGSIRVQGSDSEQVELRVKLSVEAEDPAGAQKLFDDFKFEFSQKGDDVTIRIKGPSRRKELFWLRRSHERAELALSVTCPRRYDVNLETLTGALWVDGLTGEVRGSSTAGSVTVGDIEGPVFADSNAGAIHTGRVQGRVVAKTMAGGIRVREVTDGIDAVSHSGGVVACLSGQPRSDSRLSSIAGDVVVRLGDEVRVDVDAHTVTGRVLTEFPLESERSYAVQDKIHGGGPKLVLRATAGDIHLKRMDLAPAPPRA